MNIDTAKKSLRNIAKKRPSVIGKAIDVLYQEYGSYNTIAQQTLVSRKVLSKRHRIFHLPKGIQWKVDEGHIKVGQACYISRLKDENDQRLLAFVIVEEKLSAKECEDVVSATLKQNRSLKEVLSTLTGVRFDKTYPLLLPIGFDLHLAISQNAWDKKQNWGDLCYRFIRQGLKRYSRSSTLAKGLTAKLEKVKSKKISTEMVSQDKL